jgi:hypothetical protein
LLQHWVLCELLQHSSKYWNRLRFVDAYSMAPLATERFKSGPSAHLFDHARDRAKPDSTYERTWRSIVEEREGYPNSAALVSALWLGTYSMLLCEHDKATVQELREWALEEMKKPKCLDVVIAPGDWRQTFQRNGWESADLTVLSFDPDMFNRHGSDNGRNMAPSDLTLIAKTIEPVSGALLVQLSTYDVNDDNGQREVEGAVRSGLEVAGLQLVAVVSTDRKMMSLVLARGCEMPFMRAVAQLASQFNGWLTRLKTSEWIASQPNRRLQLTAAKSQLPPLPPLPRGRRG